jgi:hypothetical protein
MATRAKGQSYGLCEGAEVKVLRYCLLTAMAVLLLLSIVVHLGGDQFCTGDCASSLGTTDWLVMAAGFVATVVLTWSSITGNDRVFNLASAVTAGGALSLILLMSLVLKRLCDICYSFDLTAIALSLTAFRVGWARFAAYPVILLLMILPVMAMRDRFFPKTGAICQVEKYPGEQFDPARVNVIVFVDPACRHCRVLLHELHEHGDRYNPMFRWVCRLGDIEQSRFEVAAIADMEQVDPGRAAEFIEHIAQSDHVLTREELSTYLKTHGAAEIASGLGVPFRKTEVDRLLSDSLAADACSVRDLPTTYVVLSQDPRHWIVNPSKLAQSLVSK